MVIRLTFLKHQHDLIQLELRHLKARVQLIEDHYNFIVDNEECLPGDQNETQKYLVKRYSEYSTIHIKINDLEMELRELDLQLETANPFRYMSSTDIDKAFKNVCDHCGYGFLKSTCCPVCEEYNEREF